MNSEQRRVFVETETRSIHVFRVFATPRRRKTFRRGTTRALAHARPRCSRTRASLDPNSDRDDVADGAPRCPRARDRHLFVPRAKTAMSRGSGRFASRANKRVARLPSAPPPADPPRLPAYFAPFETHRRRSCRSGRPTWRRPTPRRCVPRVSRDARHVDAPRERRTPTVAFVPDPTPPPQWDGGKGSHHPDYDPQAKGNDVVKASRETEELLNAIVKVRLVVTRDNLNVDRSPSRSRTAAKKPTVFFIFSREPDSPPDVLFFATLTDAASPRESSILSARADDPRSCAE